MSLQPPPPPGALSASSALQSRLEPKDAATQLLDALVLQA